MSSILKKITLLFGHRDILVLDSSAGATIAGMQQDIDAYDFVFANLIGHLNGKFGARRVPAMLKGLARTKEINDRIDNLCLSAFRLRNEYEKLKKEYEKLKWEYEVHHRD